MNIGRSSTMARSGAVSLMYACRDSTGQQTSGSEAKSMTSGFQYLCLP